MSIDDLFGLTTVAQLKLIFVEKLSEFMVSWEAFLYQI